MLGGWRQKENGSASPLASDEKTPLKKKPFGLADGLGDAFNSQKSPSTPILTGKDKADFQLFLKDSDGKVVVYDESPMTKRVPLPFRKRHLIPRSTPPRPSFKTSFSENHQRVAERKCPSVFNLCSIL